MEGAFSQNIPLFITFIEESLRLNRPSHDVRDSTSLWHTGKNSFRDPRYVRSVEGTSIPPKPIVRTVQVLQGSLLAPFLFRIVIDFVSRESTGEFGYLTHKGNNQDQSGRQMRSTTCQLDYRVNYLAFADDISLIENESSRAQHQLDPLKIKA